MFGLTIANIITRIIVLLVAMSVHEYAHAYVANLMGDSTAKDQGKMTLDPRANISPMWFLVSVITGFGILGSAPVNPYRMRNPRQGMFLAVLAGPVSNLLLAAVFAIPFRLFPRLAVIAVNSPCLLGEGFGCVLHSPAQIMLQMILLNVVLFVFNLLPFSPLDGWLVVLAALPPQQAVWWERNRQNSMYVLIGLMLLSFLADDLIQFSPALSYLNLLNWLIVEPSSFIKQILIG